MYLIAPVISPVRIGTKATADGVDQVLPTREQFMRSVRQIKLMPEAAFPAVMHVLNLLISFVLITAVFAAIYNIMPDVRTE